MKLLSWELVYKASSEERKLSRYLGYSLFVVLHLLLLGELSEISSTLLLSISLQNHR